MLKFNLIIMQKDLTKRIQLLSLISVLVSFLAFGTWTASAQQSLGSDQHCSASYPCTRICGNHVCAPGESIATVPNQNHVQNTTAPIMTQNNTNSVPTLPQNTTSQNVTSENMTIQGIPLGTSSSISSMMNGVRMVTDSKMCLASVDRCVMVKMMYQSPMIQLDVGIGALDVSCKSGYQLVLKATNNFPACVKPSTETELIKRGWAMSQEAMMKEKVQYEPNGQ